MTTGTDYNRVNLIMAVLEKRVGLNLANMDAYVNIVGGIKIQEPALDLSIAVALASSHRNRPCPANLAVMGEIGLTGEVRGIPHLQKRVQEARKLGFTQCLTPAGQVKEKDIQGIHLLEVKTLGEALERVLA